MKTERTTLFLMANLGSEMSRLFSFKERGENELAKSSAERAIKIIDSIVAKPNIGGGKSEAEILRSIVSDMISALPNYSIGEKELNSYFMPFAIRAMSL
ncbi:MAG: hypothetical protein A2648_01155 [Candidatus Lloydbacteria bacterium RIFCSPHIGHO2_01_FULL_41_20]|uniref:Uncharacterized protein n=1 Tax=Candidatus Lloydbacteria bacterium RIFCSPHIGHO2_01_FULL_41_20 TaxID=1798657 RepID=A0A1G2CS23_9BACT|nr:MAG: hypothetical protein A2648_01155 [Candidatus Lloydbacteria bacterium RIFCSPHIGHO2_01_FULL_41_20]